MLAPDDMGFWDTLSPLSSAAETGSADAFRLVPQPGEEPSQSPATQWTVWKDHRDNYEAEQR